ncbi:MAG: hypothetical protein FWD63_04240 [Propionibacteriaceae bacterium]|nr:hypothetical protein [Propionibacteriaceae bacterium]
MPDKTAVRRRVILGVVVGVLVIAVGVLALLGGFAARKSTTVTVPLGQEVDNGEMVFLPVSATLQFRTKDDTTPWEIVIQMKVRNPQTESLRPMDTWSDNIVGVDPSNRNVTTVYATYLGTPPPGDSASNSGRRSVPPDNKWMDMNIRIRLDATYVPQQTYMVGFRPMVYSTSMAYGLSSEKEWHTTPYKRAQLVKLPLTSLPDTDSY